MRTITHTAGICTYYGQLQVGENYWYMRPTSFQSYICNFSPTWSCVSLPPPTTASGWKLLIYEALEVLSRYRDPQLQVGENYWYMRPTSFQSYISNFSPTWSCVSLPRPTTLSGWKLLIYEAYLIPVIYQWFFTHLKLCLATETHNFKLVKITDIWGLPHSSHHTPSGGTFHNHSLWSLVVCCCG